MTRGGRNNGAEIDSFVLVHARIPGVRSAVSVLILFETARGKLDLLGLGSEEL